MHIVQLHFFLGQHLLGHSHSIHLFVDFVLLRHTLYGQCTPYCAGEHRLMLALYRKSGRLGLISHRYCGTANYHRTAHDGLLTASRTLVRVFLTHRNEEMHWRIMIWTETRPWSLVIRCETWCTRGPHYLPVIGRGLWVIHKKGRDRQ